MYRTLRPALRFLIATACVIAATFHPSIVIAAAAAQGASGFITGLVRDASGAPIPGAAVAVINERTGTNAPAVSNAEGVYRSAALAAGAYRVETALDGFETAVQRVTLDVGQTVSVDVTLTPSQLTRSGDRHGAAHRRSRAGSADSGVGHRRQRSSRTAATST